MDCHDCIPVTGGCPILYNFAVVVMAGWMDGTNQQTASDCVKTILIEKKKNKERSVGGIEVPPSHFSV
jgi:hypothetical protein